MSYLTYKLCYCCFKDVHFILRGEEHSDYPWYGNSCESCLLGQSWKYITLDAAMSFLNHFIW